MKEEIMKRVIWFVLFSAAFLFCSMIQPASAQTAKPKAIEVKAATFMPRDQKTCEGYVYFEKLVNERAKGELVIKWVGGPEAVAAFDQGGAVARGLIDMSHLPPSFYAAPIPSWGGLSVSDLSPAQERESGIYDFYVQTYGKIGIRYLGRSVGKSHHRILAKVEMKGPKDLAGKKLRVSNADRTFFEKLGAVGVLIPTSEIYTAIQQGLVVGTTAPWMDVMNLSLFEVAKYYTTPEYMPGCLAILMNLNTWDKLPDHLKKLLSDCMIETENWATDDFAKAKNVEIEKMKKAGVKIVEWSPEDTKFFKTTCLEDTWRKIMEKDPENGKVIKDLYEKAYKKYGLL
jgi:TRAP-type C4-dicarboxylate transport system substrate-binding protein